MGEAILIKYNVNSTNPTLAKWTKIAEYKTAGSLNWIAPDILGNGTQYDIGVYLIGGGGSGCSMSEVANSSSTRWTFALGGCSGRTLSFTRTVTPGEVINGVIGLGGASVFSTKGFSTNGNAGGTTSFDGRTAGGGSGGMLDDASNGALIGAQLPTPIKNNIDGGILPPFGGIIYDVGYNYSIRCAYPSDCINPFTKEKEMAAGGSYSLGCDNSKIYIQHIVSGGKYHSGLGGGDVGYAYTPSSDINAGNGTSPGCGGGPAFIVNYSSSSFNYKALSGRGADGGVYIYILEVQ